MGTEPGTWRVVDVSGTTCAESMGRMAVICGSILSGESDRVLVIGTFGTTHFNVGWFDDVDEVVDVEACRREGVELVRRPMYGGGTAFYDGDAVLVVSQIVREDAFTNLDDALEAWQPVVDDVLGRLGLEGAKFEGSSDVRWNGRKLGSFMANAVLGCYSIGGYLNLHRPDLDLYRRCHRVPPAKFADKAIDDPIHYIVTPEEIRGSAVDPAAAKAAFLEALTAHSGMACVESGPTDAETAGTTLFAEQMASDEQLYRISSRRFADAAPPGARLGFSFHKAAKLIRAGVALEDGRVSAAMLAGDMFISPPEIIDDAAAALVGLAAANEEAIRAALAGVLGRPDVHQADEHLGIDAADLTTAVVAAVADAAGPKAQ